MSGKPGRFRDRATCWARVAAAAFVLPAAAQPLLAQPAPAGQVTEQPTDNTIGAEEALDRAAEALRVAEAKGPDAAAAFERAKQFVDSVLEREPFHERGQYYKARLLIVSGRAREALSTLERWVKSAGGQNDWEGHLILGKLYMSGGFNKLARPVLETARALNPLSADVLTELARCHRNLGNLAEAGRLLTDAIEMLGPDATVEQFLLLAEVHANGGQWEAARAQVRRAIDKAERSLKGGETPDRLQTLRSAIDAAVKITSSMIEAEPGRTGLYSDMARSTIRLAEVDRRLATHEALRWALAGLSRGGNGDAQGALAVQAAKLLIDVGEPARALDVLQRAIEVQPDYAPARALLKTLADADSANDAN